MCGGWVPSFEKWPKKRDRSNDNHDVEFDCAPENVDTEVVYSSQLLTMAFETAQVYSAIDVDAPLRLLHVLNLHV